MMRSAIVIMLAVLGLGCDSRTKYATYKLPNGDVLIVDRVVPSEFADSFPYYEYRIRSHQHKPPQHQRICPAFETVRFVLVLSPSNSVAALVPESTPNIAVLLYNMHDGTIVPNDSKSRNDGAFGSPQYLEVQSNYHAEVSALLSHFPRASSNALWFGDIKGPIKP